MRALKGRKIQWQAGVTSKLAQDDRMLGTRRRKRMHAAEHRL